MAVTGKEQGLTQRGVRDSMKHYWATVVLAVTFGGLTAYLYFVELPSEHRRAEREAQETKLLAFEEHQIRELTVHSGSSTVTLEPGSDGTWTITAPIQAEADNRQVQAIIRALVLGKVSRIIEQGPTDLAPFGLEVPSVILSIRTHSGRESISLGASGPLTSTLYAMRGSDKTVILTNLAPKDFLNKTLMTFRKKEVLDFEHDKVQRLRLTYPRAEFVLYRLANGDKERWRIRSPIEADADQAEVKGLLFRLRDLTALDFVDQGPEYQALIQRTKTPQVNVIMRVEGTDRTATLFQPDPGSGEVFAMTDPQAPLYRISPLAIKDLTKDLFALRDKRLLGMEPDNVVMLLVKTGNVEYVLIQQNDQWVLEDQPRARLNRESVNLFVSRVLSLPAELQVRKEGGPLAPYGLSSPRAEFVATDRKGKTSRLSLGKQVSGLVYAKANGLPGIYQARADILDQVPTKQALLVSPDQS